MKHGIVALINYIPVLFACVFYGYGSTLGFPLTWPLFLISQILLVLLNYIVSDDKFTLAFLNTNLLISTIIANALSTHLYYANISSDGETLAVGSLALVVGVIFVSILFVVSMLLKKEKPE